MRTIDPKDLIGCKLLKETQVESKRFRSQIIRAIIEKDAELKRYPDHFKFLCEIDGETSDDIYTFDQVLDLMERDSLDIESDTERMYGFCCISAHQAILRTYDRKYRGLTYYVLVEWKKYENVEMELVSE
jgi:hypothetical protein